MKRDIERLNTTSASKRNPYFEAIRGIAIMMVVAIHTFIIPDFANHPIEGNSSLIVRQIFNAAVPLFLAISGFFLSKKQLIYSGDWWNSTKRQILKVYYPVLLWSFPLLVVEVLKGQLSWWSVLSFFFCGFSVYYFVLLIIQFYLLAPVLQKIGNKPLIAISGGVNFIALIFVSYTANKCGFYMPFLVHAGLFVTWMLYFALGMILGRTSRIYSTNVWLVLLTIGLIVSVGETHYLLNNHGRGVGIKPSAMLVSVSAIMIVFSQRAEDVYIQICVRFRCILEWIGKYSFAIYLSHCYIKYIFPLIPTLNSDYWILRWMEILLLDIVFLVVLRKVIPSTLWQFIGLK